jgi:hypothetical protein
VGSGGEVRHARASLLEREYGFGVVRQLFDGSDPDAPAAARSALGHAGGGESTFAVLDGLHELTVALVRRGPLLLSVDDLQWCDPASLRFVAYLVRRIAELPVLVAASVRTGEPVADELLLTELAQDPATVGVRPRPLSAAATATLVRDRLGAGTDQQLTAACQEVTAGNPLLVRQLLAALAAEDLDAAASAADVRAIGGRAVSRSVLQRLTRMSDAAVAVARAVAILGDPPGPGAVAALAGTGEEAAVEAIEALERADILTAVPPVTFVHPLVRDAVYLELSAVRRGVEHGRAARLLYEMGASPERIAAQLLLAPPGADPWVVARLREAADVAMPPRCSGRGADAAGARAGRAAAYGGSPRAGAGVGRKRRVPARAGRGGAAAPRARRADRSGRAGARGDAVEPPAAVRALARGGRRGRAAGDGRAAGIAGRPAPGVALHLRGRGGVRRAGGRGAARRRAGRRWSGRAVAAGDEGVRDHQRRRVGRGGERAGRRRHGGLRGDGARRAGDDRADPRRSR